MNDASGRVSTNQHVELPKGWIHVRLSDISEDVEKVDPKNIYRGEFVYVDIGSIDNDAKVILSAKRMPVSEAPLRARQLIRGGDVLFSTVRTYLKNIAAVPEQLDGQIASTGFCVLRGRPGIIGRYLYWYCLADEFVNRLTPVQRGTSYPAVRDEDVKRQFILIPPVSEQERIVAKIEELFSELDAGVASLKRVRALLKKYRQAVLKAAVTGELTRDWRERNRERASGATDLDQTWTLRRSAAKSAGRELPEPRSLDRAYLWDIPESWAWCSVDEAGDVQLGQQRAPQHHKGQHMRPYLRVANVLEDELDLSDVKSMNFEPKELRKFELHPEDILLNEGQAPDLLGRSAIYNGEIDGCCIQKTLLRFRAYGKVSNRFAQIVFRHYMYSGRFKKISRITTNIGHLTRVRFVALEFPFPPIEEQEEIASRFEAIDTNIKYLDRLLDAQFDAPLRQSILKAAFAGKLVPQDSDDEPASVLLERIRAERAARPEHARGRRRKAVLGARQLELLE